MESFYWKWRLEGVAEKVERIVRLRINMVASFVASRCVPVGTLCATL